MVDLTVMLNPTDGAKHLVFHTNTHTLQRGTEATRSVSLLCKTKVKYILLSNPKPVSCCSVHLGMGWKSFASKHFQLHLHKREYIQMIMHIQCRPIL